MSSPVIQFKRGQAANIGIASFKAGEPGFTTDKYDFYIGVDGTAANQQFFGSSRYWEREDGSSAAQLKFVDKDGSNSINFQAPNTLAGIGTWILPDYAAGSANQFLKVSSVSGNQRTLDWATVTTTFDIAADSGTNDEVSTGSTITFVGGEGVDTTVSDNEITIAAEIATATNAGIASFPASTFFFNGPQVGVVTATDSVKGIASFDSGDFGVTSGAVTLNDAVVKSVSTGSGSATPSGHAFTIAGTANEIETSGSSSTVTIGLPNDVTIGNNLTVTNNLYVNGSTTQVNVDTLTVDDPLIATGTTSGGAPGSDFAKDLGILMHYYSASAKLASVYWDNSEGRMVMASVVTESSNVLTATSHATVEIGSLMLSDAAGTAESVITVSGSDRVLENIIVDAGTF